VNIPFPSLFNPDSRTLKTVDELKKGRLLSKQGAHSRKLAKFDYSGTSPYGYPVMTTTLF